MSAAFHEDRLRRIVELVESGSLCTIQDLAAEFKLSASHLQHLFKARTGSRLGRKIAEKRLQKASLLLLESNMSVKEIAFAVGYKHPSSFVRAFARRFQQAPGDFRQEMLIERRFG
jgi:AraC-like DNA-binding protein